MTLCACDYCGIRTKYPIQLKESLINEDFYSKLTFIVYFYFTSKYIDLKKYKKIDSEFNNLNNLRNFIEINYLYSINSLEIIKNEINIFSNDLLYNYALIIDLKKTKYEENKLKSFFCYDCFYFFELNNNIDQKKENLEIFKSKVFYDIRNSIKNRNDKEEYLNKNLVLDLSIYDNNRDNLINIVDKKEVVNIENTIKEVVKNYSPDEILLYLNERVTSLDSAKSELSVIGYHHYQNFINSNLRKYKNLFSTVPLLIGSTGTGKSYLIKKFAETLDLPHITIPATSITASGWAGADIGAALSNLYKQPNGAYGIVHIDEFDKISSLLDLNIGSNTRSFNELLQNNLLTTLEGEDGVEYEYNSQNMLFILSGAFQSFFEKKEPNNIGFERIKNEENKEMNKKQLIKEGFKSELVGRISTIIQLEELTYLDFILILKIKKDNIVDHCKNILKVDNVELILSECAYEEIARLSFELKSGARALKSVIFPLLSNIFYEAPFYKDKIDTKNFVYITAEKIKNNDIKIETMPLN